MKTIITWVFIAGILSGCAVTQLVVPNNPDAEIFVNNKYRGTGSAMIMQRGFPASAKVVAKYHGKEIGNIKIKRRVDYQTCASACLSYGIGFIISWGYPETVIIPCIDIGHLPPPSTWDNPSSSKWVPENK